MSSALTKELVLDALKKGKITYNLRGDSRTFTPAIAREVLLRKVSAIQEGESEVDMSIAFDRHPSVSKA